MSNSNAHINLFTNSGCLTSEALKGHISDTFSDLEKDRVKNHLDSCELCSAALEGFQLMSDPKKLDSIVTEINENLQATLIKDVERTQTKKFKLQNRLYYFAAAASVIILIGFYFYLQDFFNPESGSQSISQVVKLEEKSLPPMPIAKSQESNTPVELAKPAHKPIQSTQQEIANGVAIKTETENTAEPELMVMEEEDVAYVAPLKTLRAPESIPQSLAMEEIELDVQEDSAEKEYLAVDIASAQPLEYYIGGVVVYDNAIVSGSTSSEKKMNLASQMVATESKKGKRGKRQENVMSLEKSESFLDGYEQNENHFFYLGNEIPQFPGGYEALISFLNTNLNYPKEAREQGLQGQLVVSFIVGENGEISSVAIVHGIGGGCDEEAIRVIESMPAWEPALKDEKPVRVLFNMPITFKLN